MWIRSQSKETLIDVNEVYVDYDCIVDTNEFYVMGNGIKNRIKLGTYSTKEKALKVFDMIEKKLIENNTIICNEKEWAKYVGIRNCVFQMPQDDEVK